MSKKQNLRDAYSELEEVIAWFEKEEIDLEEGIKKFERGLELAQFCRTRLSEVENKVKAIKEKWENE